MVLNSFPDLCVADVGVAVAFYRELLGLEVTVDHGWYAELGAGGRTLLAVVERSHETVPPEARVEPQGLLVSFEVDDVDLVAAEVQRRGIAVVLALVSELGQRHLMVRDPDGSVVDIIQPVPMGQADRRRLVAYRRASRS
jgi:catechol 2,3-dioxygenase-like lactoylglutathione lyase family enzyme